MYTDTLGFKAPGASMKTLQLFKGVVGDVNALEGFERALTPALPDAAAVLVHGIEPVVDKKTKVARLLVTRAQFDAALAAARAHDPRSNAQDIRGLLLERVDALRDVHGLASLVIDEGNVVRVSIRSRTDDTAKQVASALGGGGHNHSAGVTLQDVSLAEVAGRLDEAFHRQLIVKAAALRLGRS